MMVKLIILVVILGCVGLFVVKGPDGEPLMTVEKLFEGFPTSLSDLLPADTEAKEAPAITKIYKWKDENGVWQFSNSPVDEEGAEIMELDGQINTVQAFKAPPTTKKEKKGPTAIPGVMTVSPQQAGNMMDTVKNLQETIDQRKAEMDAIGNNN